MEAGDCTQRSHGGSETSRMHRPYASTWPVFEMVQKTAEINDDVQSNADNT